MAAVRAARSIRAVAACLVLSQKTGGTVKETRPRVVMSFDGTIGEPDLFE